MVHLASTFSELGKTYAKANGWFVEPQGQVTFGYMRGGDYTSSGGLSAQKDAAKSFVGRLGVVLGRKLNNKSDYYLKANFYREFTGSGDYVLATTNNYGFREEATFSQSHKDNWFELGLGGNVKLNKKTHAYGDILKTFGADIEKKWQVNAGVRWEL